MSNVAKELLEYCQRLRRLNDEKKEVVAPVNEAIKDLMTEAKGRNHNPKTIRRLVSEMEMKQEEREDLDVARAALESLRGLPLGDAALERLGGTLGGEA